MVGARMAAVFLLLLVATACEQRVGGDGDGTFGNDLVGDLDGDGVVDPGECVNPGDACAGSQPMFWAAVNSPYYRNDNGDPFTSRCLTLNSCNPDPSNPEHRSNGYRYAIDVAEAGQTVTVQIYDAPAYYSGPLNYTQDSGAFRTQYEIFGEDGSATVPTDPGLSLAGQCAEGPGRRTFPGNYQASTHHNRWWTLCTFTAPVAGTYPLQVKVSDLAADAATGAAACTACTEDVVGGTSRRGINSYAIRATADAGPPVEVSALGDMSLFLLPSSVTSTQRIIEVPATRAGDRLVVDLYDPGDTSSGSPTIELNGPGGLDVDCTLAYGTPTGIRTDPPEATEPYSPQCRAITRAASVNRFNDRWVRLTATVPESYACTSDCWWTLTWANPVGGIADRVTIAASITEPN